jgi:hypothetical protein
VTLEEGLDLTGDRARKHPLVTISGDAIGLRRLCDTIERVLRTPGYHTHLTGRDGGVETLPTNLMVTIERIEPDKPESQ